ncbi:GT4 family glycosyltransferase PelF [Dactylosporangium sp. NPDC051541]|uniref:GT4 family glycosyltransferase PelF n=1 Tax=Dactylosporangium sp. NPDC051541 TaxID=3363977 RepID=UPI0037B3A631
MKVALVSEGTYPFAMGGVSVWCDQLLRGLPDYRWDMVALTVDGSERELWPRPENLDRVVQIPLWAAGARRRASRPGSAFRASYPAFLTSLVTPLDPHPEKAAVERSRFVLALRGLYEYAADGGDLGAALTSNDALHTMTETWHGLRADGLVLADAVQAASLIEHMLRPLSAPPVRADVVHTSMNGLSVLVGMAAKWRHGTPVLMSEHGIYLRERYLAYLDQDAPHAVKVLVLSFFRALAGAGYLISDALAPHSSYNRRWQLRNGAPVERMWTMYNGVSPESFPAAEEEPAEPTVVFVGRIDPLKDLHTLIRAFAVVHERMPEARLRVFGATPPGGESYRDSCSALIDELGIGAWATMEGRVADTVHAYHSGSIVALTSISEGFPYTVVEAMACGRTVVCTDVGGVAEAVGDAGMVVPPRDVAAIADACVKLLDDATLRQQLAARARERVMGRFTLAQSLDAYRRLYERVTTPELTAAGAAPASSADPQPLRPVARPVVARAMVRRMIGRAAVRKPIGRATVPALRPARPPDAGEES